MMKVKRKNNFIFYFVVAVGILLPLFGACKKEVKEPPQISDIQFRKQKKEKVKVGESVGLYVDLLSNPSNEALTFDWSTDKGTITPQSGSTEVTYQAPEKEGSATVNLVVKSSATGTTFNKMLTLQIVPKSPPVDVIANFVFAGWMGDGERFGTRAITLDDRLIATPHSPPACVRITYRILPESVGWAGIYAQYNVREEGQNWGTHPGMDLTGYTKLVWWAKGETGNEMVEFKAGGIDATYKDPARYKYKDSFEISLGTVRLERTWKRYELDLTDYDLSSVIGGFCWVATARSNPNGLTFYVDSITYE